MTFESLFGERLRDARKALGLSQAEAAEKTGVTREHWGRCERGLAVPGGEVLAALAALGVDVLYILTGTQAQPSIHERLKTELRRLDRTDAEAAAALGLDETQMRWVLAGKMPLDAQRLETLQSMGVDLPYLVHGKGKAREEYPLNERELQLLRDYRKSSLAWQDIIRATAHQSAQMAE